MSGALSGLKVLDFSTLLPGPYATMCMADMGADVLRVVSGTRPDLSESTPPFLPHSDVSAATAFLGRNKRVLTLNLKDPRSLEVIHRLLKKYDIILEQFRPGVMERFGLDYESLKTVRPDLIYCSLTGYGQTGPLQAKAGHDINYISLSGVASYSGKKESGPSLAGLQIADVASGSNNAVIGLLAAVIFRQNTGKGQHIDISMLDGTIALNALFGAGHLVDHEDPGPEENIINGGSLYDYYATKDGRYVSFGGIEPQFFRAFCETIGRADLAAGGIYPATTAVVKEEVRTIIKTRTLKEWVTLFQDVDACFEPVLTLSETFNSPHVQERGIVVEVPTMEGEPVRQVGNPILFSESAFEYRHAGITCAQANNEAILQELGYTQETISELLETGLFT